ncbi:hydantoinase/oxoprolinase family protein [uncultured Pseudacidovorax sp.]|uniref:hydantoinase/oxoprolinase family protein n=1 Tax=uncultured Pseudacidovorax sp. TaxID=679313 RepID=UPI0025D5F1A3|nr:hydantoinase/oxoprolinase family protein [uncultured Pseudacidovorax sp.]
MSAAPWSLGVDMGGTFVDAVALHEDGRSVAIKHPRAGRRLAEPVVEALDRLCAEASISPEEVGRVVHGSTVITNLLLERDEPPVALVLTRGFGDVPVLARQDRRALYEPVVAPAVPEAALFPQPLRFEIGGRIDAEGREVEPLDLTALDAAADAIATAGVQAVAVCLLFSHRNPSHEQQVGELLRARLPHLHVSLSHQVDPAPREFERALTTALDAYAKPLAAGYLRALAEALSARRLPAPMLMHSEGTVRPWQDLAARPIGLAMSGPCAALRGVAACLDEGAHRGAVLTLDVGGTSADIGLLHGGEPAFAESLECGGLGIRQRCVDIASIAIGGGSVLQVLAGAALRIGPRSQGAWPGPAAYGQGGTLATLSDALCVLGRLPDRLAGGLVLDRRAAEAVLARDVAVPLGLPLDEAAEAVVQAAAAHMAEALKTHAFQRGLDPADALLVAVGGGGAQHAAEVAALAGIAAVRVLPQAGVMAALGMVRGPEEVAATPLHTTTDAWAGIAPEGDGPAALFAPMTTVWVPAGWCWRIEADGALSLAVSTR